MLKAMLLAVVFFSILAAGTILIAILVPVVLFVLVVGLIWVAIQEHNKNRDTIY